MSVSWVFPFLLLILTVATFFYMPFATVFVGFIFLLSLTGIRVIYQYENGVKFTVGRFTGLLGPGLST